MAAFSQADEDELVFLQPPEEYLARIGKKVLWQCLKVREGRRSGAKSWQEHFAACIQANECPGQFKQNPKTPSQYHSISLDVTVDLHVDDGYATGPPENLQNAFTYLSTVLVLKISPLIMPGMSYNHVGTVRLMTEDGIWAKPFEKYIVEALDLMGMTHCKPSTSPKLDKSNMEGDDEPFHDAALYRTVTCKLI